MGRAPCCDKAKVKKGPWSPEEDAKLKDYMHSHGNCGNWIALPHKAGLKRCGKSCRLRWLNYLRPNIKHGEFSDDEDRLILTLFSTIGSRWSIIAAQLPGRTDNDIKNYWNTKLKKKLMGMSMATHNNPQIRIKPTNTAYLQQSPLLLSPALSSTTVSNYNNTLSFTGFDQSTLLSHPPNGLRSAPAPTILHQQSSYLVFGGAPEPSCSSINGSSSVEDDDHQKNISTATDHPLIWEEAAAPLVDYGLEEIKQLISSTNTGNYFDEGNTGERSAMMYY